MSGKYVTERRYHEDMKRMRDQMVEMFLVTAQILDLSPDQSTAVAELKRAFDHIFDKHDDQGLPKHPGRATTHDYKSFCYELAYVMTQPEYRNPKNIDRAVAEAQRRHTFDSRRAEVTYSTAMALASGLLEGLKIFEELWGRPSWSRPQQPPEE